jgi:phospholipid-binding lipoprotein MlaA
MHRHFSHLKTLVTRSLGVTFRPVRTCIAIPLLTAVVLSGCASSANMKMDARDPYEATNRKIHRFNVSLDKYAVRPISKTYNTVTPGLLQLLIHNGLNHLNLPRVFVNNVLSGNFYHAADTLGRFAVNTLMGAGGLLDPATDLGIPRHKSDFGITLAIYGVPQGAYIELPFLGPSSVRHTIGRVVDMGFSPTTYFGNGIDIAPAYGTAATGMRIIDQRTQNNDTIDYIFYSSEDSYASLKSVYLQNRQRILENIEEEGQINSLPDIYADP